MQQHIAQLEAEKTKLLARMNDNIDQSLKGHLAAPTKTLALSANASPIAKRGSAGRHLLLQFPSRFGVLDG